MNISLQKIIYNKDNIDSNLLKVIYLNLLLARKTVSSPKIILSYNTFTIPWYIAIIPLSPGCVSAILDTT